MAIIQSANGSDLLVVDPISNAARVTLYGQNGLPLESSRGDMAPDPTGFLQMGLNDGRITPMRTDRFGSIALAYSSLMFSESFDNGTVNNQRWNAIVTTMAATQQSASGFVFNSGNITTINTGYMLKSNKTFMKLQRSPLQVKMRCRLEKVVNSVVEFGFGDATTATGVNTTGAYWQQTTSGIVQPVLTFNGVDKTGVNIASLIDPTKFYSYDVIVDDDSATFFCQEAETGTIVHREVLSIPATGPRLFSATQIPIIARLYISGTAAATAPKFVLSDVYVAAMDVDTSKDWSHTMAAIERGIVSNPSSGVQLANWANSAAPASATLSNTAAGYTTLGGLFQFAAIAGAVTDYALFAFQVPAPHNLTITGIEIDVWNTGAAGATTPTLMVWGVSVGSGAVSLATGTVMRRGLGAMSLPVGAPIGSVANRLQVNFDAPLHCPAGRFVHLILRIPVGTATASQIIAGQAAFQGYFD